MIQSLKNLKFIALFSCLIIFPFIAIYSYHGWGDDWAFYLAQARSIAENDYSNFLEYNQFNVENSIGNTQFVSPWGFPLLLSFVYKIFGNNYLAFKIQQIFFVFIFYFVLFVGLRKNLNLSSRLVLISLFGLNIIFLSPINEPSTDYLYLSFSLLSIFGIYNFFERKEYYFNKYFDIILLSLLISFTESIREIGISLLITIFAIQLKSIINLLNEVYLLKKKIIISKNLLIYSIPYLIYIFYNLFYSNIFPNDENFHINEFYLVNIKLIISNCLYYLKLPIIFFSNNQKIGVFFYLACLYPFAIGFRNKFKVEFTFFIYILTNLLILVCFPHRQGLRYVYPILPFFFYYVLIGLNIIFLGKSSNTEALKKAYKIITISLLTYFCINLINFKLTIENYKYDSPFSNSFIEATEIIKESTNKNDKILFFKPRLLKYLTDRDSFYGFEVKQFYISDYFLHYKRLLKSNILLDKAIKTEDLKLIPYLDNEQFSLYKVLINGS